MDNPLSLSTASKQITIKNLDKSNPAEIFFTYSDAVERDSGLSIEDVVYFEEESFVLNPLEEKTTTVTINVPIEYEGVFEGNIFISAGGKVRKIPYKFSRLSVLRITREPDIYPNVYVHNVEDFDIDSYYYIAPAYELTQEIPVKAGTYYVYATKSISDIIDDTGTDEENRMYTFVYSVTVPPKSDADVYVTSNDGKKYSLVTKDREDDPLRMSESRFAFLSYENEFDTCSLNEDKSSCVLDSACYWYSSVCLNKNSFGIEYLFSFSDYGVTDFYLSDVPDDLNTDYVIGYVGWGPYAAYTELPTPS
jgi:hypothetical protein